MKKKLGTFESLNGHPMFCVWNSDTGKIYARLEEAILYTQWVQAGEAKTQNEAFYAAAAFVRSYRVRWV